MNFYHTGIRFTAHENRTKTSIEECDTIFQSKATLEKYGDLIDQILIKKFKAVG